jgi:hypothetical protein
MAYYTYLIASLPFLHFGGKIPFSYADFLRRCQDLIPAQDLEILRELPRYSAQDFPRENKILSRWFAHEIVLRNELVKIRASRRHAEAQQYLRVHEGYASPWLSRMTLGAYRNPSPLEAERLLDALRWQALEDLGQGHFFDAECLLVYALKLLILERWDEISRQDGEKLLQEELEKI